MHWLVLYIAVFLVALTLSAVLCAVARRLGRIWGLLDQPEGRKAHDRAIAMTGGWGIFATFGLLVAGGMIGADALASRLPAGLSALGPYLENIAGIRVQVWAVLGGAGVVFALGLTDDLRPLGPKTKLAVQLLAVVPLVGADITIRGFLPGPIGWLATALWVLVLTNSFNLLDNMDGLAGSVALVICLVLVAAALQGGELWLPALFLCLAGTLAGFMIYNFHPASLFMGDAGSLTVGYLMAVFSILITYFELGCPSALPVLMPLAIMGVLLFDTLSVLYIRRREGRPLMVGDRSHFSHRLLAMGFSVRAATFTIALLAGACGLLALPLRQLGWGEALVHLSALAMLFGVIVMLELTGRRGNSA